MDRGEEHPGKTLLETVRDIAMARDYCLIAGTDPDAMVAGYIVDATGQRHWVSKARWRWYRDVVGVPDDTVSSAP